MLVSAAAHPASGTGSAVLVCRARTWEPVTAPICSTIRQFVPLLFLLLLAPFDFKHQLKGNSFSLVCALN